MRTHKTYPKEFPEAWASDWGEDEYGLWMGFTYKGVRQDFRWIEPGTFLMGSLEDEPERESNGADETQHEVELTQGFWLADSVVTQALWKAVMDTEPSNFKGESLPVEEVSWEDAQAFIQKMNDLKAELQLCLPTEAQWEYTCRAGTTTTFSFGGKDDLNLERVNYSGKWDGFNSGGETKPVKSYAPNNWGLYEMHGNILEWCEDWYGQYSAEQGIDPKGAETGTDRVLRGGSWFNYGRGVRSAYRSHNTPGDRSNGIGFRLARGSFSQSSQ